MKKILILFFSYFVVSACGSADDFTDGLEEVWDVDSILVKPPLPSDSTNVNPTDSTHAHPSDTIIIGNDTIITHKGSTSADSIFINDKPEIELTKLFKLSSMSNNTPQGFAIYGKYLFNCHHSNDYIDVFDLETQKTVVSIKMEPEDIVHCNNVNFGNEFYNKDDKFPLLYIQQRGVVCKLNVYRIICEGNTIVTAEKVQVIYFGSCSWCINTIDNNKNLLYAVYGYNGKSYVSSFRMPSVTEGNVSFHPRDAYKTYYRPFKKVGQDTAFDNKYLYIVCGYVNDGELWRIDMDSKVAKLIDLTKFGLYSEPEGIDVVNDDIYVSFTNDTLYKIRIIE